MVAGLSALTRLELLSFTFKSPRDLLDRVIRIPPPHTRTHLSALTFFHFRGAPEYVEDIVAQIDAPLLEGMMITLFHQKIKILEVSQLAKFVRRADKLSSVDHAVVTVMPARISALLSQESRIRSLDPKILMLIPRCREWDFRLSYIAQFCTS